MSLFLKLVMSLQKKKKWLSWIAMTIYERSRRFNGRHRIQEPGGPGFMQNAKSYYGRVNIHR